MNAAKVKNPKPDETSKVFARRDHRPPERERFNNAFNMGLPLRIIF